MSRTWIQGVVTLTVAALLLVAALAVVDLLDVSVFLVVFVPFVALAATRMRTALHWTLFIVVAGVTIAVLVEIDQSESSTAGFGVVIVPLLLLVVVLLAAVVDRAIGRRGPTSVSRSS
jgi:hypothetical protein